MSFKINTADNKNFGILPKQYMGDYDRDNIWQLKNPSAKKYN